MSRRRLDCEQLKVWFGLNFVRPKMSSEILGRALAGKTTRKTPRGAEMLSWLEFKGLPRETPYLLMQFWNLELR